MRNRYVIPFLLLCLLASVFDACQLTQTPLFETVPASESGVTFVNRIYEDNDSINILKMEYVYNGGGVGIGDFDLDGRPDLFFSGNQVPNKLYLNRTEPGSKTLRFEDATQRAGVEGKGQWRSGVTVVDINSDGRMDLYVTATMSRDSAKRKNRLYVNQGVKLGAPVFKEMAEEYGIADNGHSTHAAFFDYDNDGDLDLYVLTNTIEQYPNAYRNKITDGSSPTTDRLYRNMTKEREQGSLGQRAESGELGEKNKEQPALSPPLFVNVSKQAGIQLEGYGLGINICDLNQDGWKDIYVTNDYLSDDLLYINNQDGTFTDRSGDYFKHTSASAMGNDVADINNDGLAEVIAVDMLPRDNYRKKMLVGPNNYQVYLNNEQYGHSYQYVRNTLQLNQGLVPDPLKPGQQKPAFSEISLLADVAETDWSWSPLLADFDNDGWRDLLITNGFPKDVTDRDFMAFRSESGQFAERSYTLAQIPVVKISNYAFRNNRGNLTFEDVTEKWGLKVPSFSNGAAYADLDGDGDLDYVVNNINDSAFVYRNTLRDRTPDAARFLRVKFAGSAHNRSGLGARVEIKSAAGMQVAENTPYRGYLSSVEPGVHFGLGNVATLAEVRVIWPAEAGQPARQQTWRNVAADQTLLADIRNAREPVAAPKPPAPALFTEVTDNVGLTFDHRETEWIDFNNQKLLPHKLTQFAPAVASGDIDSDGLADLFVGGSRFKTGQFFRQQPNGTFVKWAGLDVPADSTKKPEEDMGALFFDADGDGRVDLYVASGGAEGDPNTLTFQDRFYANDGKGRFRPVAGALPANTISKSCVKAADFDHDGDLDLFVGGRVEPNRYPKPVSSLILRNDSKPGQPRFTDVTGQVAPALRNVGLVCDALWTDADGDGWADLLLAGEWMPITLLKNQNGRLQPAKTGLEGQKGLWSSLVSGDFDHDGDMDYVAGNLGLNARLRATDKEPVRIYAGDLDNNGFYDAIPTIFIPDKEGVRREFPLHGRDDLIKQMISMRRRFPYFKDFTEASADKLLTEEERKNALVLEANYLQSGYIENKGGGQFSLRALPIEAQLAPLFGMVADDVDQDGHLDLMLVGNDYSGEVMMGRYDAMNGLWLKGNGNGKFAPQRPGSSGFYVPNNAKGLAQMVDATGHRLLVATQNRGRLCAFRSRNNVAAVPLQPLDAVAWFTNAQGQKRRIELDYGQSFLSQSARQLAVGPGVKQLEIADGRGRKRLVALPGGNVAKR